LSLRIRRRFARFVLGAKPNTQLIDFALDTAANCPDESRIGAALGLTTYNVEDRIVSIDVPTTVVCGTADFVTRYGNSVKLAEMIPGATLITIKDAGHMVLWENPDEVTDAIAGLVPAATPAAVS
jgi:pimeloyl-ACP methyl ester carboxylesterase